MIKLNHSIKGMSSDFFYYFRMIYKNKRILLEFKRISLLWRRRHCRWRSTKFRLIVFFIMFVCLDFFVQEFFTHLETLPLLVKDWKLWLSAIKQWGFFSVPHLWHGASVYNGRFRGPVTLTPNAERLARSVAAGIRIPNLPLARRTL